MSYRIDWRVIFRAISRGDAELFVRNVLIEFPESTNIISINPWPGVGAEWECYFVTPPMDISCAEVIRKSFTLGKTLGYLWNLPTMEELGLFDELIRATMHSSVPKRNSKFVDLEYATFRVVDATVPMICPEPLREREPLDDKKYTVQIRDCDIDECSLVDAATTAIIHFEDGSIWKARFVTYQHVETLRKEYVKTGVCNGGRFVAVENMILVEHIDRATIEETVHYLIGCGIGVFGALFAWLGNDDDRVYRSGERRKWG